MGKEAEANERAAYWEARYRIEERKNFGRERWAMGESLADVEERFMKDVSVGFKEMNTFIKARRKVKNKAKKYL